MSAEGSSSATDSSDKKAEVMKKVDELIAKGKRHMVCGEVPKAVNVYEEAVKLVVEECGEMSYDCANAYFNCGSALLELGRMETNVLGVALDGVDVEEEKEEPATAQFEKPPDGDDGDGGTEEGAEDEDTADGEESQEGEESQDGEESQEGEEKDEDVSHFQLSWEYLDIAKVIYLKSDIKEDQLRGAECLMKLGELSMETEQHETAATDLQSALTIQQKQLDADDRTLAETHYQLGLAYGLGKEFELSIQHYTQAISVIEAKIASLNKLVEEKEIDADNKENRETDSMSKYKEEIKELQELIPEMRNKIEDTRGEQKDMDKMKQMAKELLGMGGTTKGFGSPTKKVDGSGASSSMDIDENGEKKATDITSMIRKKRKPEEEETPQEQKKARQDDTAAATKEVPMVNGTSTTEEKPDEAAAAAASAEPVAV